MSEVQVKVLDANRKSVRVGDIVRRTVIVDHAGRFYTVSMCGYVVDVIPAFWDSGAPAIVVSLTRAHQWSVKPWCANDWTIVGRESFS